MLVMLLFKQNTLVAHGSPFNQIAQNVSFYKQSMRVKKSCQEILTGSQKTSDVVRLLRNVPCHATNIWVKY